MQHSLSYIAARLSTGCHECVRLTAFVCPCATACVCARARARVLCGCVCVRRGVHSRAGLRARSAYMCAHVCGLSVCVHSRVCAWLCYAGGLFGCSAAACGIPRVLGGYSRALEGYSRALDGHSRRTHASVKRSSRSSHRLMGCTLGVLRGYTQKVRTCVCGCASFGLYITYHRRCTARHRSSRRTGSSGGVLDEYSRRSFVMQSIAARASAQGRPRPRHTRRRHPRRRPRP
jgi:hypothetical protein